MNYRKQLHAINELNRVTNLILEDYFPRLEKFVGSKILIESGLSSKFDKSLFENVEIIGYTNENNEKEYATIAYTNITTNGCDLYFTLRMSFKDNEYSCFYKETLITIGSITDKILTRVIPFQKLFVFPISELDVELEKQTNLIEKYKQLQKEIKTIESQIIVSFNKALY